MEQKLTAEVKAISEKNNAVCLLIEGREQWFDLAERVKLSYVKKGPADVKVDYDETGKNNNPVATYIRSSEKTPETSSYPKKAPQKASIAAETERKSTLMLTSYAKDIFLKLCEIKAGKTKTAEDVDIGAIMHSSIKMVKQAYVEFSN